MGTIMTLYVVAFSCFFHMISRVLHKYLLYLQIFSTGFFKDYIHSSRRSCAQGGVLQYKIMHPLKSRAKNRHRTNNCRRQAPPRSNRRVLHRTSHV
jgi:hypothetical protein